MPAVIRDISAFTGPCRSSGNQVNYQTCPVCGSHSWKVYVDPSTGKWYCHAGSHSAGGTCNVGLPTDPGAALRDKLRAPESTTTHWPEVQMPPHTTLSAVARRYLEGRGFSHSLGMFSEMKDSARVLVPYRGPSGTWIYWNSRKYLDTEQGPKYLAASGRHPLYVLPRWAPCNNVVLVEGVFDAIATIHVAEADTSVIALGGKSLPRYLLPDLMTLAPKSITILLDADAVDSAIKLRAQLQAFRVTKLRTLPPGQDPASMLSSNLRSIICE